MKENDCIYNMKTKCNNKDLYYKYCPYWKHKFCPNYTKPKSEKDNTDNK